MRISVNSTPKGPRGEKRSADAGMILAMAAGVTNRLWSLEDMAAGIEVRDLHLLRAARTKRENRNEEGLLESRAPCRQSDQLEMAQV